MTIGYKVAGPDNDNHMCSWSRGILEDVPGVPVCPKCGYRTDFDFTNPEFKYKGKKHDYSYTHDLALITSERFRRFCMEWDPGGVEFRELPRSPGFFHTLMKHIVKVDLDRMPTRKEKLCKVCGNYESVVGVWKVFLLPGEAPLRRGFCRSDWRFAGGNEKSPLIFVDPLTKEQLEHAGFDELDFKEILA